MQRFDCEKYLFVVDRTEYFEDNIVEEIDNSSHMGKGKEYVVLIEGNSVGTKSNELPTPEPEVKYISPLLVN